MKKINGRGKFSQDNGAISSGSVIEEIEVFMQKTNMTTISDMKRFAARY